MSTRRRQIVKLSAFAAFTAASTAVLLAAIGASFFVLIGWEVAYAAFAAAVIGLQVRHLPTQGLPESKPKPPSQTPPAEADTADRVGGARQP